MYKNKKKALGVNGAKKSGNLVKRNAKSSIFTHLFSLERYRKELYLSFHPRDRNISEYEKEVDNIMDSLYDQKTATKMFGRAQYAKGERKGRREGRQEGIQVGIQRGVLKLFKKKAINAVVAAETLNMTKKEFMELAK